MGATVPAPSGSVLCSLPPALLPCGPCCCCCAAVAHAIAAAWRLGSACCGWHGGCRSCRRWGCCSRRVPARRRWRGWSGACRAEEPVVGLQVRLFQQLGKQDRMSDVRAPGAAHHPERRTGRSSLSTQPIHEATWTCQVCTQPIQDHTCCNAAAHEPCKRRCACDRAQFRRSGSWYGPHSRGAAGRGWRSNGGRR